MEKIILKKISTNYGSEPNIADPMFCLHGDRLILIFPLNYRLFDFKEGQKGSIVFFGCTGFRSGAPNDEGFYLKDNKIWNREDLGLIDWHSFYEVSNVPSDYYDTFYKNNDYKNNTNLKHYVFFMKEGTFECLAESYEEKI